MIKRIKDLHDSCFWFRSFFVKRRNQKQVPGSFRTLSMLLIRQDQDDKRDQRRRHDLDGALCFDFSVLSETKTGKPKQIDPVNPVDPVWLSLFAFLINRRAAKKY
jgi:hypothetical protein